MFRKNKSKKRVSDELRAQAVTNGLCADWQGDWLTIKNKDELCEMFIKGIKFCAYHRYPAAEYITENFGDTAIEHGIYANEYIEAHNPKILVAKGTSCGRIIFDNYAVGTVHALDCSSLEIHVKDHAIVWVYAYNNADVLVYGNSSNAVKIHHYEGNSAYVGNAVVRKRKYSNLLGRNYATDSASVAIGDTI